MAGAVQNIFVSQDFRLSAKFPVGCLPIPMPLPGVCSAPAADCREWKKKSAAAGSAAALWKTLRKTLYHTHSVMEATQAQSTISSGLQPRETSLNGLRKPCTSGPIAVAPASRSVAL